MESFTIILSVLVFTLLTIVFSFLIYNLYKSRIINIKNGSFDSQLILEEDKPYKKRKKSTIKIFFVVFQSLLIAIISFSIFNMDKPVKYITRASYILSGSMSKINEKNKYLTENNIDNQIDIKDLIFIEKLPEELKLYDIVVYKNQNDISIIHRIVEITKDDDNKICYVLRGDANETSDKKLVYRDDMIGIYNNHKIKYLGLFVRFLHSIPGLLCIILFFIYFIVDAIISGKIDTANRIRSSEIRYNESVEKYEKES